MCSPFVSMCGQVKMCGCTSEGNLVCENLSADEFRRIFQEKSLHLFFPALSD